MNKLFKIVACFLCLVVGAVGGFYGITYLTLPATEEVWESDDVFFSKTDSDLTVDLEVNDADLSIHFLELGNKYTGDCTYIKTKTADILIDCGSKTNSISTVANYLNQYVTDGKLEYVIVTHAHQDHYAGFASDKVDTIFDLFECEVIIDFAQTNQKSTSTTYANYIRERNEEVERGAKHFTALDCINGTVVDGVKAQRSYDIGENPGEITLNILDSYYYSHKQSSGENNHSVCTLITQNTNGIERNYLFTGDLEEDGEDYLVKMNPDLPIVDLYKAGHHGSKTSSSNELLSVVQPKTVCVCCCAGSSEYTTTKNNQFPTQDFIDRIAKYTTKVFVTTLCIDYKANQFTSFNGNIVVLSTGEKFGVKCSNNDTLLKDSDWFKNNRTCPEWWLEPA